MIRITLLTLLIAYLSVYAWKDWFRTACWLVLLMAVFQHPDMPKSVADIPGLNHWNFLFLNVVFSWLINRNKQNLTWEMPLHINTILIFYYFFIFIGVLRYFDDMTGISDLHAVYGWKSMEGLTAVNEYLINCVKWVVPAMIIFDGCRNRQQYNYAVIMLSLMFVFLALQVIKAMTFGSLVITGDALQRKAIKVISGNVGFHRVNISMIMSGAFWAVFCLKELVSVKKFLFIIIPACVSIFLAMAMTGGRMGYITWLVLGFILCAFRWRKFLLLAPLLIAAVLVFAPSTIDRLMQGVAPQTEELAPANFEKEGIDTYTITSGRVIGWPIVWHYITESPFLGYGREAMQNTGITMKIMVEYGEGEVFSHPHNAYLEWTLDNGFIGALPVFLFYFLILKYSWSLFKEKQFDIYVVTGGLCFALVFAFLFASTGSQTFYPREGAVGMWVAIALMLRVYIEREKLRKGFKSELIG
ncbi:O-antigen ligase family protein [Psychromonas ossibalaenae]|uniref:O-antigen ligase family protein n=1 Tax=Psychromonas ossibalaenae TaxID=444922 RepID=UPI00036377FE|nr:O-antigen ligase family protein [Psychromonas ossibalaenae]